MRMVVGFQLMPRMKMLVGTVVAGMIVVVDMRRAFIVGMFVQVFMRMLMGMAMGMLVAVLLAVMDMLMAVSMAVFMGMEMLMLVFSFHRKPPFVGMGLFE